ncbi:hypothetical protein [Streptosporangium lutulentum]|uniref:Uncharacterized protein n=1 Tax=Streptosporangium lutulentum TaxID=1461250 RepID=A0ABT9QUN8_9ACTN|nr:hypothetical protein [Streptosporangium lutulentum]MDP9850469.1 hypothetical protein [Streptosporangium lutulentum]
MEFAQSVWPHSLGAEPTAISDLVDRAYLLRFVYTRYWRSVPRPELSPEVHILICCLLRATGRDPQAILHEATHDLIPDSAEVLDFVRHYYAADGSPLRDFAPCVDGAYLREHPEALAAAYQQHLDAGFGRYDRLPAHLHTRIRRFLGM